MLPLTLLLDTNLLKGLKVTNERQDDETGILHQVAQFPIGQVTYIQSTHVPLCPHKTQRDKVLAAKQVGLYASLNPHPLLREAVETCGQ